MNNLSDAEKTALRKAIMSTEFRMQIGAEEWDLTEEEEEHLCDVIERVKKEEQS